MPYELLELMVHKLVSSVFASILTAYQNPYKMVPRKSVG